MDAPFTDLLKSQFHLGRWLLGSLVATTFATVAAIISDMLELQLLISIRDGFVLSDSQFTDRMEANDTRQMAIGVSQLIASILAFILWLVWTFKSNKMARALGAAGLSFSPAWSVGWYFIPVASLFQPYRALSQIIRAIRAPGDWRNNGVGPLPIVWWLAFCLDEILIYVSAFVTSHAEETPELINANLMRLLSDCTGVVSYVLTALLLVRMFADQQAAVRAFGLRQNVAEI